MQESFNALLAARVLQNAQMVILNFAMVSFLYLIRILPGAGKPVCCPSEGCSEKGVISAGPCVSGVYLSMTPNLEGLRG